MTERLQWFVSEEIGPNRALLPNGFLLCKNVPLARIGSMDYGPGETPVSLGPRGYVTIERSPEEVFDPRSLASYTAATFTDEHPADDVGPQNWRALSHGVVLNAERGERELADCVVGDLVVMSPELITAVQQGKREVSVGYTCDYDEIEPGRGRQRNIVVNHVALVERGRCGWRCAIGDKAPTEIDMTARTTDRKPPKNMMQRAVANLRAAFATKDEEAIEQSLAGAEALANLAGEEQTDNVGGGGETHIHLHTGDDFPPKKEGEKKEGEEGKDEDPTAGGGGTPSMEQRMASVEASVKAIAEAVAELKPKAAEETVVEDEKLMGQLKQEVPAGTSDEAIKTTKDSAILAQSFAEVISLAEQIAPGMQKPSFDPKEPPKKTFDAICGHRRRALDVALTRPETVAFVKSIMPPGRTTDTLSCDETRGIFKAAAAFAGARNTGARDVKVDFSTAGGSTAGPIKSIADLNAANRAKYRPEAKKAS